jgi:threonine dehydratase
MPSAALTLPTSEDVAAARVNIRGFAVRTPLLKLSVDLPGVNIICIVSGGNIDAPKLGAILNGESPF